MEQIYEMESVGAHEEVQKFQHGTKAVEGGYLFVEDENKIVHAFPIIDYEFVSPIFYSNRITVKDWVTKSLCGHTVPGCVVQGTTEVRDEQTICPICLAQMRNDG